MILHAYKTLLFLYCQFNLFSCKANSMFTKTLFLILLSSTLILAQDDGGDSGGGGLPDPDEGGTPPPSPPPPGPGGPPDGNAPPPGSDGPPPPGPDVPPPPGPDVPPPKDPNAPHGSIMSQAKHMVKEDVAKKLLGAAGVTEINGQPLNKCDDPNLPPPPEGCGNIVEKVTHMATTQVKKDIANTLKKEADKLES